MTELTDDELLIIWRFNFAKTNRQQFLDIARAAIAADRDLTAALAEPADAPAATPAEIGYLLFELRAQSELQRVKGYGTGADALTRTAELLERHAAPVPVPVAERLPGREDCDEEGYCWRWNLIAGSWTRQPVSRRWYEFESHWLPASALPLPAPQGGEVEP